VALASYVAAGISKSKPLNVAVNSCKMGIVLFILPFMFVYQPVLILQDIQPIPLITAIITSLIGVIAISGGFQRYLLQKNNMLESVLLIFSGLLMLYPESITDIIGVALFIVVVGRQKLSLKKNAIVQD